MLKKAFVSITILILILALASVSVFAQGGTEKKKPPTTEPPPTEPSPTEPPAPPSETPPPDPPPVVIPDTGELYGDLYVILRDENGVPILNKETIEVPASEEGPAYTEDVWCIQPIATDNLDLYDQDPDTGAYYVTIDPIYDDPITIYPGEPFVPASYVDAAGDLVECELSLTLDLNDPPTDDPSDDTLIYDLTPYVQAVDFGRLNLGRAPDAVIAHGLDEAVVKLNSATAIYLDPAGRLVLTLPDAENPGEYIDKTIDAPAENLALYIKMMLDGHWITDTTVTVEHGGGDGDGGGPPDGKGPPPGDGPSTEDRPVLSEDAIELLGTIGYANLGEVTYDSEGKPERKVLNNHDLLLASSLLAAAADKTGTFTLDKVIYINSVYGINQAGSLQDELTGKTYFDFSVPYGGEPYLQDRHRTYGNRSSGNCRAGRVWVLQPTGAVTYSAMCIEILAYENSGHNPRVAGVHFTDMEEAYTTVFEEDEYGNPIPLAYDFIDNVRGFTQSVEDALRVIEYIHNYKVPEVLYE